MPYDQPLPAGLTPVAAGRWGMWLLCQRKHAAALKRDPAIPHVTPHSLTERCARFFVPWHPDQYPGIEQFAAYCMGVSRSRANHLLYAVKPLPSRHAATWRTMLANQRDAIDATIAELDSYIAARDASLYAHQRQHRSTTIADSGIL